MATPSEMKGYKVRMAANEIMAADEETGSELEDLLHWLANYHPALVLEYAATLGTDDEEE